MWRRPINENYYCHSFFRHSRENKVEISISRSIIFAEWIKTHRWTSLIPPDTLVRGWLYDIECSGCGGGPAVVPLAPDSSDWGCCADCWLVPTWGDRIAASISFRRCHLLNFLPTDFSQRAIHDTRPFRTFFFLNFFSFFYFSYFSFIFTKFFFETFFFFIKNTKISACYDVK